MRHPEGRPWTPDELGGRLVEAFATAFGVSRENGRPVATGVLFSPRKGVFIHYACVKPMRMGGAAMSAAEALKAARAAGLRLGLDGDDLVLEASAPPPPVLNLLSRHKASIVA